MRECEKQFLHVALGSSGELETYLELCKELYGIEGELVSSLAESVDHFQRMTNSLIGKLKYD